MIRVINLEIIHFFFSIGGLETLLQPELEQVKAIRDGKVEDDVEIKQK